MLINRTLVVKQFVLFLFFFYFIFRFRFWIDTSRLEGIADVDSSFQVKKPLLTSIYYLFSNTGKSIDTSKVLKLDT